MRRHLTDEELEATLAAYQLPADTRVTGVSYMSDVDITVHVLDAEGRPARAKVPKSVLNMTLDEDQRKVAVERRERNRLNYN